MHNLFCRDMPFGIGIIKSGQGEKLKTVQIVRNKARHAVLVFVNPLYLGFGTVGHKGAERYDMPPPVLENTYPAGSKMPSEKAFQTAFVR
ncbi:hypothetical protein [Neisseria meningitidis]|uniref:hypothetical protein n=1 Tax=Neisseria meningitidis TaxID=487 RepID=UPI001E4958F6|nr:hypothetical protein [Neisseria meningitidis]